MAERLAYTEEAVGSNPSPPTPTDIFCEIKSIFANEVWSSVTARPVALDTPIHDVDISGQLSEQLAPANRTALVPGRDKVC